jgi:hypothetical protein
MMKQTETLPSYALNWMAIWLLSFRKEQEHPNGKMVSRRRQKSHLLSAGASWLVDPYLTACLPKFRHSSNTRKISIDYCTQDAFSHF